MSKTPSSTLYLLQSHVVAVSQLIDAGWCQARQRHGTSGATQPAQVVLGRQLHYQKAHAVAKVQRHIANLGALGRKEKNKKTSGKKKDEWEERENEGQLLLLVYRLQFLLLVSFSHGQRTRHNDVGTRLLDGLQLAFQQVLLTLGV